MSQEEEHSGIPTRAIHESYLDMQRSLQKYRDAKDRQNQARMQNAHGNLQQNVLTLYELLRPHLKDESALSDWWEGKLPNYKGEKPPDPEEGRGILQVQQSRRVMELDGIQNPDRLETLEEWHSALELNGNIRIAGIMGMDDKVMLTVQEYQKGLRWMDDWETKYTRKTKSKGGFMSDKQEKTVERQRIPVDRLTRAARELSDVANKLGALSNFDASSHRTEITKEQIDRLEKWRQENVNR